MTFSTISEWKATKRWEERLDLHAGQADKGEMRGFVYEDDAYVELMDDGRWCATVNNFSYIEWRLWTVEDYLWKYHSSRNAATSKEVLGRKLEAYCKKHVLPYRPADDLAAWIMDVIKEKEQEISKFRVHLDWINAFITAWSRAR